MTIDELAAEMHDFIVNKMNWSRHWAHGGCYLHLEVSEFIEALRGKGDPVDEMGDVFVCLLSLAHQYGVKPSEALKRVRTKMRIMSE